VLQSNRSSKDTHVVETYRPANESELQSIVQTLARDRVPTEVVGAGSKRAIGRTSAVPTAIAMTGLNGISLYEPTELVMSAGAGTSLAKIEATLADRGQMLAFEPMELGPATGGASGLQTIGGVFATNFSGARRISHGAARDHLLGVRAVNGRGEVFKSGGRVLKNVTGYDVARALTGSWGTLAVFSEVTFKVLPRPRQTETLVYVGLSDEIAAELACLAMGTPFEVSGTAHLTAGLTARLELRSLAREAAAITAMRLENFESSIAYRTDRLTDALKVYGRPARLGHETSLLFWSELRRLSVLSPMKGETPTQLWRISTAPRLASKVIDAIKRNMAAEAYYDASGGIIWVEVTASADAGAADIRRILSSHGGHATLIRAEPDVRASVEVFQPMSAVIERLSLGIKEAFDPGRILNPGRMYGAV
jgi:glycolate oxidase FAD binding subunit